MDGDVLKFPSGRLFDGGVVREKNRQIESNEFVALVRQTLAAFPNGIPVEAFPVHFQRATGLNLDLEGVGFTSAEAMFEKMGHVVLKSSDLCVYDREVVENVENDRKEEETTEKVLEKIYLELLSAPESYFTTDEVKQRLAESGIHKDTKEIMQILWTQHKDHFRPAKVAEREEWDLVAKAVTEQLPEQGDHQQNLQELQNLCLSDEEDTDRMKSQEFEKLPPLSPDGLKTLPAESFEIEERKSEEELVLEILKHIHRGLVADPESYVRTEDVKERFDAIGIHKTNNEIMNLLWVQHKDRFKTAKVAQEWDIVTQALTESVWEEETESKKNDLEWEKFPVSSEDLETLPPDGMERFVHVAVAQYNSPFDIWINLGENLPEIQALIDELNAFYENETNAAKCKVPEGELREGMPCAAVYEEFGWHRAVVERISADRSEVEVRYVDYGSLNQVPSESIRRLERRFFSLPAQAIPVCLPVDALTCDDAVSRQIQNRLYKFMYNNEKLWAYGIRMREEGKTEVELLIHTEDGTQLGVTQVVQEEKPVSQNRPVQERRISAEELMGFSFGDQWKGNEKNQENSGAEEAGNDLVDLGEDFGQDWIDEVEEELRNCLEKGERSDFVPTDPDAKQDEVIPPGMSADAAMLRLRVLEIQKMRLTEELSRPGTSDQQRVNFSVDELDSLNRQIRAMEDFIVNLGATNQM